MCASITFPSAWPPIACSNWRNRPNLFRQFEHAIGGHAEGKVILAHIAGLQAAGLQPLQQVVGTNRQSARLRGGKEVHGVSGNCSDLGKYLLQAPVNAPQETPQCRRDVVLRCSKLKRENAARIQLRGGFAEELDREEAVQLRGLWLRQVEDDNVKCLRCAL